MKLTDLRPSFIGQGGEGITRDGQPVLRREGVGLACDCPCGCGSAMFIPFANPLDGGPNEHPKGWQREGDTFETLTLRPSIRRLKWTDTHGVEHGCGWHGFITNGDAAAC
jgi:hypothetical protein